MDDASTSDDEPTVETVVITPTKTHDGKDEDLALLSKWVRKELFNLVQFVYKAEEDLVVDGDLYKMFLHNCHKRLVGLRLLKDADRNTKIKYVHSVWIQATGKKTNLVCDGLNARRSSVYSAMQNRFVGKYKEN